MNCTDIHKRYLKPTSKWIRKYPTGYEGGSNERSYVEIIDPKVYLEIVEVSKRFVKYKINYKANENSNEIFRETITSFLEDCRPCEIVDYGDCTVGVKIEEKEVKGRGKKIPVIAKQDLYGGVIKKGEKVFIQAILYTKEEILHNGMASYYHKDTPEKAHLGSLPAKIWDKPLGTTMEIESSKYTNNEGKMAMVSMLPVIAPIGSYKSSVIITEDGRTYPDSIVGYKSFQEVFEKI